MKSRTVLRGIACLGVAVGLTAGADQALGGAVIMNGDVALGVNDEGHLNIVDPTGAFIPVNTGTASLANGTGLAHVPTLQDATNPGCSCEGWGVSASGDSGSANVDDGIFNLVVDSFVSTPSTATSEVHLASLPGLAVKQAYAPSVGAPLNLYEDKVTITNTTGGDLTDLRYVRVMDWDVPPTEFEEFVTIIGTGTTSLLERSHNDGFDSADPLIPDSSIDPVTEDTDFVDFFSASGGDHGAYFRFNFGTLADGDVQEFSVYYGVADNERDALNAIIAEGIELFSLGQSDIDGLDDNIPGGANNDGLTFIFGFKGVGGEAFNPVPEPVTAMLGGLGLAVLGAATRRRRA